MKSEVHCMLEEMQERMNRDMRSHETLRTHDRSTEGMWKRDDLEPREWRNQTIMMRAQDNKHVIPESQEYNS